MIFITLKNNTNEPFLESCGTSWSQMTANCGSRKSSSSCRGWQDAAHSGGSPYKCYWSTSKDKCRTKDEPCSTEQATANDAYRAEQDRLARLADEERIAQEKIDAKIAACGSIDTPQYDTPNWSYGGVIQPCPNYIDPEIEAIRTEELLKLEKEGLPKEEIIKKIGLYKKGRFGKFYRKVWIEMFKILLYNILVQKISVKFCCSQ